MKQYNRIFILIEELQFVPYIEAGVEDFCEVLDVTKVFPKDGLYMAECHLSNVHKELLIRYGSSSSKILGYSYVRCSDHMAVYIKGATKIHRSPKTFKCDDDSHHLIVTSCGDIDSVFGEQSSKETSTDKPRTKELRKGLYISSVPPQFGDDQVHDSLIKKGREDAIIKGSCMLEMHSKSTLIYSPGYGRQCYKRDIQPSYIHELPIRLTASTESIFNGIGRHRTTDHYEPVRSKLLSFCHRLAILCSRFGACDSSPLI